MSSKTITCASYAFCIDRSMAYANKGDYKIAVASFLSDIRKSECTKCILNMGFLAIAILEGSTSTSESFKEALSGFCIDCKCGLTAELSTFQSDEK